MKKTIKILIMATVLMLMFGVVNAFAADDIGVYVDGKAIEFDVAPQIINDRTMIPFRYVANAFKAGVDYREEADGRKIVTAVQGDKTLTLTIGNTDAVLTKNGKEEVLKFDVAPVIVEGRTLVPVRLVGKAFGCSVGWDNENRNVIIIDIESGVTANYKEACPEIFDEILTIDFSKIQGYYNAQLYALNNGEEEIVTMSIATDDDAAMISLSSDQGDELNIIAATDAIYMSSDETMGLWMKYSYENFKLDFKIGPDALVIDSNALLKLLADYIITNDPAGAFATYEEILSSMVSNAVAGNMEIVTEGDLKMASYVLELPDTAGMGIKESIGIFKGYQGDVLAAAEAYALISNSETDEPITGIAIVIEKEDAAEDFNIVAPSADMVVTQ